MHRTQIYLDPHMHQELSKIAVAEHISISAMIREILNSNLQQRKPAKTVDQFFEQLPNLKSFTSVSPTTYTRKLRQKSRLLQTQASL